MGVYTQRYDTRHGRGHMDVLLFSLHGMAFFGIIMAWNGWDS